MNTLKQQIGLTVNWINNFVRPKIRSILKKSAFPADLWIKCPISGNMCFLKDAQSNQWVIPSSEFHLKISPQERFYHFLDNGEYQTIKSKVSVKDPLKFRDRRKYQVRLTEARSATNLKDCILAASGSLNGMPVTVAAHNVDFMLGTLGTAAGEMLISAIESAYDHRTPFIVFTAAGGARIQEGILSLMQMPRIILALCKLRKAALPYIVVLTNPTTGGVTASYAMLGDINIAEPLAMIGFAGPRVIEETIREKLPMGFQTSEFMLEHGLVDIIVHRHELRDVISSVLKILTKS